MSPRRLAALVCALSVALRSPAHAGGPRFATPSGVPFHWATMPVPYQPDQGGLGILDHATIVQLIADAVKVWSRVPTANLTFQNAGDLPVDVTVANYRDYEGCTASGSNPVIFDAGGQVTDAVLGAGASSHVAAFASFCGDPATGVIARGYAVINDTPNDGNPANGEDSLDYLKQVLVHEFGHYLGLDHSQVGLLEWLTQPAAQRFDMAMMFPVGARADDNLTLDDGAWLSALYPAPTFATDFGTISGHVLHADGTPFRGAHVVARKVGDPRHTAVGNTSGSRFRPDAQMPSAELEGRFDLPGLPPGDYTVEVEAIVPSFTGTSSLGGLNAPPALPGPPEFWNGPGETNSIATDDPLAAVPITVTAGATVGNVDILLDEDWPPPDDCAHPHEPSTTPALDVVDTTSATVATLDPMLSCLGDGTGQGTHTVWYRFTAPSAGTVLIGWLGSVVGTPFGGTNFAPTLSAYRGTCDALMPAACADPLQANHIALGVAAGEIVQFEIAGSGGTLGVEIDFTACTGVTPFDSVQCQLAAALASPFCPDTVDPKLQKAVTTAITKAEALLHKAAAKAKPKPANALVGVAGGKLKGVLAKVARSRKRHKLSTPCATEIDDLATHLQAAIAGLRR